MRAIVHFLFICLALAVFSGCSGTVEKKKPNIIFIMSDDHAKKAISCYGDSYNQTPNIDRLAEEGVIFTNAFVTNSICAPSRAVILTGMHSHRNGIMENTAVFDTSMVTFPKLLRQDGYETAMIGKWHLKSEPTGFSYWNILPGQGEYYNPDFIEMGEKKKHEGYVTNLITGFALDWLEQQKEAGKPFCLMMHHKAPHRNWMPDLPNLNKFDGNHIPVPETFFDDYSTRGRAAHEQQMEVANDLTDGYDLKLSEGYGSDTPAPGSWTGPFDRMTEEQRETWNKAYREKNDEFYRQNPEGTDLEVWKFTRYLQDYLSTVESVDASVGKILDFLDSTGLAENTIVIYTSDQGFYLGEHGWFDKRFMYEESLGTPLLLKFPENHSIGSACDELVQNLDIAPTLLDFAGIRIPETMQGLSLKPLLEKKTAGLRDAIYYHYYEYPGVHSVKRHYGIRTSGYKLIHFYYDIDEWELYDLEADPFEIRNVYGDPGYERITQDLMTKLEQLREEYGVPSVEEELAMRGDTVRHHAVGKPYTLAANPSGRYPGSPGALTDGIIAKISPFWPSDYSLYTGFRGGDLEMVTDMGRATEITSVSARFLHKPSDWIHGPTKVLFGFSTDGDNFDEQEGKVIDPNEPVRIFAATRLSSVTRYIRIKAKNAGDIPASFPGAGSPAWLFCDEVVVE